MNFLLLCYSKVICSFFIFGYRTVTQQCYVHVNSDISFARLLNADFWSLCLGHAINNSHLQSLHIIS